jgi:fucose permease
MLASLAVGPLLDSQGDKIGLVLGLVCIAVALFALPRAGGYGAIVALMFLLGVGGGIVVTGANALSSAASPEHRATALNLVNLFFGLGGLATPFLSANLFKKNPSRLCYAIAVVTVATLVVHVFTPMPGPAGNAAFVLADVGPIFGSPLLLMLSFFLFLYIGCEVGVWNWLPRHLIAQGIPESKALNILSLGFALGLLVGRVGVSPILIHAPAIAVTLVASIAMAITTFLMLRTKKPGAAAALVFLAGVSMAPVFPTTLAIVGTAFPHMTGTAIGFAITCGWAGLAVSSRIIGAIAGDNPLRIRTALLLIPGSAVLMIGLNLAIQSALR